MKKSQSKIKPSLKKLPAHKKVLLEIGVEEIPARFMSPALQQLKNSLTTALTESGIGFSTITVWGTPRRLAVLVDQISAQSKDREDIQVGPPPRAAKNEQGEWTQAALGFAKANRTTPDKLILKETPKGERYVVVNLVKGQKTENILKELLPSVIQKLNFPKSMVWADPTIRFARPIRWIVALFNSSVIRFRLAGVSSDKNTIGLLSLGGQKIPVTRPDRYKSILQGRCILVDPDERKKNIISQIHSKVLIP
jgi:glycyl-tRNA synthetase beta chain